MDVLLQSFPLQKHSRLDFIYMVALRSRCWTNTQIRPCVLLLGLCLQVLYVCWMVWGCKTQQEQSIYSTHTHTHFYLLYLVLKKMVRQWGKMFTISTCLNSPLTGSGIGKRKDRMTRTHTNARVNTHTTCHSFPCSYEWRLMTWRFDTAGAFVSCRDTVTAGSLLFYSVLSCGII